MGVSPSNGLPRPVSSVYEPVTGTPCHGVADGFDFPASHRKIKKEFVLSWPMHPSVNSVGSSEHASLASEREIGVGGFELVTRNEVLFRINV